MTEPESFDEDLFADLYEDDMPAKPVQQPAPTNGSELVATPPTTSAALPLKEDPATSNSQNDNGPGTDAHMGDSDMNGNSWDDGHVNDYDKMASENEHSYGPVGIKEDG